MLANIDELISKGENQLSPEEERLLETVAILVESYEDEHYPIPDVPPNEILKFLMQENNLKQSDLLHVSARAESRRKSSTASVQSVKNKRRN